MIDFGTVPTLRAHLLEKAQILQIRIEVSAHTLFSIPATIGAARAGYFVTVDKNNRSCPVENVTCLLRHASCQAVRIER